MPLSRELQSSIGKLCKNENGVSVMFEAARLSNNYVIVKKGLGHSKLIHCFPLHWKLEDMRAGGSLFIIHSQRLDIVAGHG